MEENNLFNRNSTNDIQGIKLTYVLVILTSSIETENQLSYCGSTIDTRAARNGRSYLALTARGRTVDRVYHKSAISASGFAEFVDWFRTAFQC